MYPELERAARFFLGGVIGLLIVLMIVSLAAAQAENNGGYFNDPRIRSCCSEADAVYADEWIIQPDGSVLATVTGGGPRDHQWAPIGRVYHVPAEKVVDVPGNPTGRPLLFLAPHSLNLYCFALGPLT
jgi:hypothetical protein